MTYLSTLTDDITDADFIEQTEIELNAARWVMLMQILSGKEARLFWEAKQCQEFIDRAIAGQIPGEAG